MIASRHSPEAGDLSPIRNLLSITTAASWPREAFMAAFLLWLILLVVCWPLALLALILYPLVWLLLLPFCLVGFAVEGAFGIVKGLFLLPARLLGGRG